MNIVDSSGWLEYFAGSPNAEFFAAAVENVDALLVPSISLYEVFKSVLRQRGEDAAVQSVAVMLRGRVLPLDQATALHAAKLSVELQMPMADSIILATARAHKALLWTQDAHFAAQPDVRYIPKA
jgi:predicted nucleic acid-binding protein